jgi:hypothetical protein
VNFYDLSSERIENVENVIKNDKSLKLKNYLILEKIFVCILKRKFRKFSIVLSAHGIKFILNPYPS